MLCVQDVCGYERDSMDTVVGYDARVIQCLQDYRYPPHLQKGVMHNVCEIPYAEAQ